MEPVMQVEVTNLPAPESPIPESQKLVNLNNHGVVAAGASNLCRKVEPEGSTLKLKEILMSSPGKARWEIAIGDASVKAVFHTSPACPNAKLSLESIQGKAVLPGTNVDVNVFNTDEVEQQLYSTLVALETVS